jgi:hypothetical protein
MRASPVFLNTITTGEAQGLFDFWIISFSSILLISSWRNFNLDRSFKRYAGPAIGLWSPVGIWCWNRVVWPIFVWLRAQTSLFSSTNCSKISYWLTSKGPTCKSSWIFHSLFWDFGCSVWAKNTAGLSSQGLANSSFSSKSNKLSSSERSSSLLK